MTHFVFVSDWAWPSIEDVNPQLLDLMEPVFINGKRVRFSSFDEIRERGRSVFVLQEDIRN